MNKNYLISLVVHSHLQNKSRKITKYFGSFFTNEHSKDFFSLKAIKKFRLNTFFLNLACFCDTRIKNSDCTKDLYHEMINFQIVLTKYFKLNDQLKTNT